MVITIRCIGRRKLVMYCKNTWFHFYFSRSTESRWQQEVEKLESYAPLFKTNRHCSRASVLECPNTILWRTTLEYVMALSGLLNGRLAQHRAKEFLSFSARNKDNTFRSLSSEGIGSCLLKRELPPTPGKDFRSHSGYPIMMLTSVSSSVYIKRESTFSVSCCRTDRIANVWLSRNVFSRCVLLCFSNQQSAFKIIRTSLLR